MAYNIAANQVLATPVESFQKGRALAFAERKAEQDFALNEQKRQANEIALQEAQKPQRPDPQRVAGMLSFAKDAATRSLSIYQQTLKETGDENAARAAAQKQSDSDLAFAVQSFGPELGEQINPDHVWTPEEAHAAIAQVDDVLGKAKFTAPTVFRDASGKPVGTAAEGTPEYQGMLDKGLFPGMEVGRPSDEAPKSTSGSVPSGYRYDETGTKLEPIPGGPADVSADWSDDAILLAAERYRLTGQYPAGLGRGASGTAVRARITNQAAQLAAEAGDTMNAAALRQVANKANQQALGALTKQRTLVDSFEKTAQKNLDLALELSAKVDRTGSPLINRGVQAWRTGVANDPDTKAFVNALVAARTEYAKVLSGATGAQGVTDAARREAKELFDTIDSPATLERVIEVAKREMENRMTSFDETEKQLRGNITGGETESGSTEGLPAGWSVSVK